MNMADAQLDGSNESCVDILLRGKEISDGDFKALTELLRSRTVRDANYERSLLMCLCVLLA